MTVDGNHERKQTTTMTTTTMQTTADDVAAITAQLLAHDAGDAPGSRYGTYARDWAPVAAALIVCLEYATGESYRTEDGELDHDLCNGLVSLVVNDSPEPADIIREYGPIVGLDPFDFIDEDEVEDA